MKFKKIISLTILSTSLITSLSYTKQEMIKKSENKESNVNTETNKPKEPTKEIDNKKDLEKENNEQKNEKGINKSTEKINEETPDDKKQTNEDDLNNNQNDNGIAQSSQGNISEPINDEPDNSLDTDDLKNKTNSNQSALMNNQRIIYVGKSQDLLSRSQNSEEVFEDIKQAINYAKSGDIIKVLSSSVIQTEGIYNSFTIDKSLTFEGENGIDLKEINIRGNNLVLGADLTFKNLKLNFTAENANSNIYLSGYKLVLDNVDTVLNFQQRNERPNIHTNNFNNSITGNKSELIVKSVNNETKFKSIYTQTNPAIKEVKFIFENPSLEIMEDLNLGQSNVPIKLETQARKLGNLIGNQNKDINIKLYSDGDSSYHIDNFKIPQGTKLLTLKNVVLRLSSQNIFTGLGNEGVLDLGINSRLVVNNFINNFDDDYDTNPGYQLFFKEITGTGTLQIPPRNTINVESITNNINIEMFITTEDPNNNEILLNSVNNIPDNVQVNLSFTSSEPIKKTRLIKENKQFKFKVENDD
ncbi:hypothetical protein NW066_06160 [Mycoplasmopsis felis]|uniref:hypothetical protein n=1 Tax=Mycoplasmopsis felis TaxID=33923 RepID=UPI0021AF9382|nr:hypothetical protein [Mycoplasmopsis felis]UWV85067.1 hypothetical protein NW066_06160 [Mycoplasmopsis felis]